MLKKEHTDRLTLTKKVVALSMILSFIALSVTVFSQTADADENQQPRQQQQQSRRVVFDEQIEFVEVRVPEFGALPRRETDEIQFSLNYIRTQFMKSNRLLY